MIATAMLGAALVTTVTSKNRVRWVPDARVRRATSSRCESVGRERAPLPPLRAPGEPPPLSRFRRFSGVDVRLVPVDGLRDPFGEADPRFIAEGVAGRIDGRQ